MTEPLTNKQNYKGLAWVAASAFFMQALDATILNTALPAISAGMHESPLEMELAVISYALTLALLIPLSGWISDRYGTLRVFRYAVLLFVLGSLACALSASLNLLIASRILQGIGGALMMPVARLAIIKSVSKTQLLAAWNLMAMAGLIGPVLGPVLGGLLVTYASWEWIFLINIPIGLIGIGVATRYMPQLQDNVKPLDWIGFLLFAGGLVALTLGLDLISGNSDEKLTALFIFFGGCTLLFIYAAYAKRAENSLLPLDLFRIRTFRIGAVANLFLRLCGSGVPFLLPLMLQVSFRYDADMAGWLMTPVAISSIITKPYIPKLLVRFGYRTMLIYTSAIMAVSVMLLGMLQADTPLWLYIMLVSLYGASMSMMFTAVNTLTICNLQESNKSVGSTLLSVIQQVGMSFAIAFAAVLLSIYRMYAGETGAPLQQAFSYTFYTSALSGIVLVWVLFYLHEDDGNSNLQ